MEHALSFAETGHLCISTLHANNANQAIDRIINFFPEERHKQIFSDISSNLQAIVSQRLIKTVDNKRAAAIEIMLGTATIKELIKKQEVMGLKEVMSKSESLGMQTFDRALFKLYRDGKVSLDEALANADSPNNLRLMIKLAAGESEKDETSSGVELELEAEEEESDEEEGESNDDSDLGELLDIPDQDIEPTAPPPTAPTAPSPVAPTAPALKPDISSLAPPSAAPTAPPPAAPTAPPPAAPTAPPPAAPTAPPPAAPASGLSGLSLEPLAPPPEDDEEES